jgi:hypothetical protein
MSKLFKCYLNPYYWFENSKQKEILKELSINGPEAAYHKKLDIEYEQTAIKTDEINCLYALAKLPEGSPLKDILDIELKYNRITKFDYEVQLIPHLPDSKEYKQEYKKIELDHGKITQQDYDIFLVIQQFEYDELTAYERDIAVAKLQPNSERIILDIKRLHHVILEDEYATELATLQKKPYGKIIFQYNDGAITCETIANDYMIKVLEEQGHYGQNDQERINQWVESICRSVLAENLE